MLRGRQPGQARRPPRRGRGPTPRPRRSRRDVRRARHRHGVAGAATLWSRRRRVSRPRRLATRSCRSPSPRRRRARRPHDRRPPPRREGGGDRRARADARNRGRVTMACSRLPPSCATWRSPFGADGSAVGSTPEDAVLNDDFFARPDHYVTGVLTQQPPSATPRCALAAQLADPSGPPVEGEPGEQWLRLAAATGDDAASRAACSSSPVRSVTTCSCRSAVRSSARRDRPPCASPARVPLVLVGSDGASFAPGTVRRRRPRRRHGRARSATADRSGPRTGVGGVTIPTDGTAPSAVVRLVPAAGRRRRRHRRHDRRPRRSRGGQGAHPAGHRTGRPRPAPWATRLRPARAPRARQRRRHPRAARSTRSSPAAATRSGRGCATCSRGDAGAAWIDRLATCSARRAAARAPRPRRGSSASTPAR